MKKVIAIVEDEKDLNELVKRYLEKEEYEVRSYLDFDEAYSHTSDEDVHLWILDIMLSVPIALRYLLSLCLHVIKNLTVSLV